MNIDSLKLFMQVVDKKSISKVASSNHISQSALSQTISKIESSLEQKLLKRSNKGVEATDMGRIVLKYSENIMKNYEKMMQEMKMLEKKQDTVIINAPWSLVNYSIPCILYKVKKQHSTHRFKLISSSNENTLRDIHNDICNIGFINEKIEDKSLVSYKMGKEKIVLVASYNHVVADKIDLEELKKYEFVTLKNVDCISSIINTELQEKEMSYDDLNIVFEVDSISAIKSSIENNFGISFLPYTSVKKELYERRYKLIEIENLEMEYDIFLVAKKKSELNDSVKESLETLLEMGRDGFC
jgi:DNA-binding transcriptional LysR family regulator